MIVPGPAVLGLLLDRVLGDPGWLPHPVQGMGWWIEFWERRANPPPYGVSRRRRVLGGVLVVITVALATAIPWAGLFELSHWSPGLAFLGNVVLITTTIAWKGLVAAGESVRDALGWESLDEARHRVGAMVGRDTAILDAAGVVRAAVESLAENITDAIVAPVCFGLIGGAPAALAYRAVNTLDSMWGYKSRRFREFGWAAARLDDLCNYIPARITGALMLAVLRLRGGNWTAAWKTWRRDARRHPSPNAGIPEAIMAGALAVQLGGTNWYQGVPSERARLGPPIRPLRLADIEAALATVNGVAWLMVGLLGFWGAAQWVAGGWTSL